MRGSAMSFNGQAPESQESEEEETYFYYRNKEAGNSLPEPSCYGEAAYSIAESRFSTIVNSELDNRKCGPNDVVYTYNNVKTITNKAATIPPNFTASFAYRILDYPTGATPIPFGPGTRYEPRGEYATYGYDEYLCMTSDKAVNYGDDSFYLMGSSQAFDVHWTGGAPQPDDQTPMATDVVYDPQYDTPGSLSLAGFWETTITVSEIGVFTSSGSGPECP